MREEETFHTLSKWGISFTDFKVSRNEATSSSEHRKKDIYFPSKKNISFHDYMINLLKICNE